MLEANVGNALRDRGKGKGAQNKPLEAQEIIPLRYKTIKSRSKVKRRSKAICENMSLTIHQSLFKTLVQTACLPPSIKTGYFQDTPGQVMHDCDCVLENLTDLRL